MPRTGRWLPPAAPGDSAALRAHGASKPGHEDLEEHGGRQSEDEGTLSPIPLSLIPSPAEVSPETQQVPTALERLSPCPGSELASKFNVILCGSTECLI